jgi:Chloroplast import apparatus Tic20-like/EF-hand domain pair
MSNAIVSILTLFLVGTNVNSVDAFSALSSPKQPPLLRNVGMTRTTWIPPATLRAHSNGVQLRLANALEEDESEIERLRSMAAKLRAEAAQLEAQQRQAVADAVEAAFNKFDTNQDGQITMDELKKGLEKSFKMELPENRVLQLMADFDKTGDMVLGRNEFVAVEQFRNRLDALVREEKALARQAQEEAKQQETAVKFIQAQLELINDQPPTATDKILSILPYLFPLFDGLQFARFLVLENPNNVFSALIAVTYGLYRAIPFGGMISFFALSFLSGNPRINRLIRFNMQQAIFVDIALFFPGLLAALYSLVGQGLGFSLPPSVTELGTDFIFAALLLTIAYATVSSLLGITPNSIPIISQAVEDRMPTVDMFDEQGRFNPRLPRQKKEEKDKDTKKDD